jgi:integrase
MASIRKRSWTTASGERRESWQVDFVDQHGKRRHKQFARKKDADTYLVQARGRVQVGTYAAESTSVTIARAGEMWIARGQAEQLERATLAQYQNHLDLHIVPMLGEVRLAKLATPMVQAFVDDLLRTGRSRPMATKVLASLKAILREAMRRGLLSYNPAAPVTIRTPGRHKERATIPSREDVQRMLSLVSDRWRPLLVTAVFTGMRASELRGLRWQDVDLEGSAIKISQRADRYHKIGPPKSAAGRRDIPLAPMVVTTLREWKLRCPSGGLVFPTGRGKPESLGNIYRRMWAPLQIKCGIVDQDGRPRHRFHDLRHFAASWLIAQGFSPKKLQAILGHSTIQMVFDRYGHLLDDADDDHRRLEAGQLALAG